MILIRFYDTTYPVLVELNGLTGGLKATVYELDRTDPNVMHTKPEVGTAEAFTMEALLTSCAGDIRKKYTERTTR
jgi:hypothetical protein